jgi:predicted ester cyclase
MSAEQNKEVVRRVLDEFWHNGRQGIIDELFAPDYVNYDLSNPEVHGRDKFKAWANGVRDAWTKGFPGWRVTIEDLIAEGDQVAKRWILRGTHKGEFMGISPTGKSVMMTAVTIYRFGSDGRVTSIRWNYDAFGLLTQLGATVEVHAHA